MQEDIDVKAAILKIIKENYEPAKNQQDADVMKTTEDIYQAVHEHIPADFDKSLIYLVMKEMNFKEDDQGDLNFVWLMKEKH